MKRAPKQDVIPLDLCDMQYAVDSRIWKIFETKAGDKAPSVLLLAKEYAQTGKTIERALADALEQFKLA